MFTRKSSWEDRKPRKPSGRAKEAATENLLGEEGEANIEAETAGKVEDDEQLIPEAETSHRVEAVKGDLVEEKDSGKVAGNTVGDEKPAVKEETAVKEDPAAKEAPAAKEEPAAKEVPAAKEKPDAVEEAMGNKVVDIQVSVPEAALSQLMGEMKVKEEKQPDIQLEAAIGEAEAAGGQADAASGGVAKEKKGRDVETETLTVTVPPTEFVLGLADLTGYYILLSFFKGFLRF